jgi:hypothetical protein
MSKNKSSKNKGRIILASPPLETLAEVSKNANFHMGYELTEKHGGDKPGFLLKFTNPPLPDDLSARAFGNIDDLFDVQRNASAGMTTLRNMCGDVQQHLRRSGKSLPVRTEIAANLVAVGSAMITSAYLLHLRPAPWAQGPALIILRSGIESVGKGGWVAVGKADEPHRVQTGERTSAKDCLKALDIRLQTKGEPVEVYEWLCNFTHLDYPMVLKGPPSTQDVYAAAAYIAWLGARVSEIIIGQRDPFAIPPRLPSPAPWA